MEDHTRSEECILTISYLDHKQSQNIWSAVIWKATSLLFFAVFSTCACNKETQTASAPNSTKKYQIPNISSYKRSFLNKVGVSSLLKRKLDKSNGPIPRIYNTDCRESIVVNCRSNFVPEPAFRPRFSPEYGKCMPIMFPDGTTAAWEPCASWNLRAPDDDERHFSKKVGFMFEVQNRVFPELKLYFMNTFGIM